MQSMFSARHGPTAQRIAKESGGMKQSIDQSYGIIVIKLQKNTM
jgi:hypothetical protein